MMKNTTGATHKKIYWSKDKNNDWCNVEKNDRSNDENCISNNKMSGAMAGKWSNDF